MTVHKTCHHLTILMNNITITIFTGFNVTIIWNIIFLRLNPLFRFSHFFTCQDIHVFGHHLGIEMTQIPIRICFCFHKMIAWESTRAMKAFFSTCQLFTCCFVNMTGHQLLINVFGIPIRRLTGFYKTITRNIFLPMCSLLRITN